MEKFLLQSEVSQQIQDEMAGQAPSESKMNRAITNELNHIKTVYNLYTYRRKATISIIPGTPTLVSSLVTDDDVERIDYLRYADEDYVTDEFTDASEKYVDNNIITDRPKNEYSLYVEDGKQYLVVNTLNGETVATNFMIKYFTTANALDNITFKKAVDDTSLLKILLPVKYQDLLVLGSMKRLLYQAIGDDSQFQLSLITNRYKSALEKLGLDNTVTKAPKQNEKKIKIRRYY